MNKYKCVHVEEILDVERADIKDIINGGLGDAEKVVLIRGIMEFTDRMIEEGDE